MILRLKRKHKKDNYTVGALYINEVYFSDTLEDKDRGLDFSMPLDEVNKIKVYGETAIPTGIYRIVMDTVSPKFKDRSWAKPYGGKVPRVLNVKGFEGVLIHPLNKASESLGCIGVGKNTAKGIITQSTEYFHKLMKILKSIFYFYYITLCKELQFIFQFDIL